jgi:hypothetical protein
MAGWNDISNLWWLQDKPAPDVAQMILQGAQLAGQRDQRDLQRQELDLHRQRLNSALMVQQSKDISEVQKARGIAAMSSHLSDVAARNAWTDPKERSKAFAIGASFPQAFDDPTMDALMKNFDTALAREAQAKQHAQTAAITELTAADTYENIAHQLERLGPLDEEMSTQVANLRQRATLLRGRQLAPTETIESLPGGGFKITRGPAGAGKDAGTPTQAVITETQKQALAGESGVVTGIGLLSSLTESDVGARGFVNEYVVNRGVAQLFPELHEKEVASGRSLIRIFNERMKKAIRSDTGNLNENEQQRLESALPSLGPLESINNAKAKIAAFVETSKEVGRINAQRLKLPIPEWTLSQQEIAAKFKAGEMTEAKARELLKRYNYTP